MAACQRAAAPPRHDARPRLEPRHPPPLARWLQSRRPHPAAGGQPRCGQRRQYRWWQKLSRCPPTCCCASCSKQHCPCLPGCKARSFLLQALVLPSLFSLKHTSGGGGHRGGGATIRQCSASRLHPSPVETSGARNCLLHQPHTHLVALHYPCERLWLPPLLRQILPACSATAVLRFLGACGSCSLAHSTVAVLGVLCDGTALWSNSRTGCLPGGSLQATASQLIGSVDWHTVVELQLLQ